MKHYYSLILLFLGISLTAQDIRLDTETIAGLNGLSGIQIIDLDGDGHQDIFALQGTFYQREAAILFNDGAGNFTFAQERPIFRSDNDEPGTIFWGAFDFADVNGDTFPDLFATGNEFVGLFINDGAGGFTPDAQTFETFEEGTVNFFDADGDTDQDLFITGNTGAGVSQLFLNDGSGTFTLSTGFPTVYWLESAVAIVDLDGDTFNDMVVSGIDDSTGDQTTTIYLNSSITPGTFTAQSGDTLPDVSNGSLAVQDVDGINGPDLFITGTTDGFNATAQLFLNDGAGVLTNSGQTFMDIAYDEAIFIDLDGDGDQDILNIGEGLIDTGGGEPDEENISYAYINNGSGTFTLAGSNAFIPVNLTEIAVGNIDGDVQNELLIAGSTNFAGGNQEPIFNRYDFNTTTSAYEETSIKNDFLGINNSASAVADVDGDLDLDIVIIGNGPDTNSDAISVLYLNDGSGNYTRDTAFAIAAISSGDVAFADVDNDLDQDLIITGRDSANADVTELYLNNGAGVFTPTSDTAFDTQLGSGTIAVGHLNGDTFIDIIIKGGAFFAPTTNVYINNGDGTFTVNDSSALGLGNATGDIALGDIDGDLDTDVVFEVNNGSGRAIRVYKNNGSGAFMEDTSNTLPEGRDSLVLQDVDGDMDLDLFVGGNTATIYTNNGSGTFTASGQDLGEIREPGAAFTDIDGDGDADLIANGDDIADSASIIYLNDVGIFTKTVAKGVNAIPSGSGSILVLDADGDNKDDIFYAGTIDIELGFAKTSTLLFNRSVVGTPPTTYVWESNAWTPSDPSGVATASETIQIRDTENTAVLTANTTIKNIQLFEGTSLDLGAHIYTIHGNVENSGTLHAENATLSFEADVFQVYAGAAITVDHLRLDNGSDINTTALSLNGPVTVTRLVEPVRGELNSNSNLTLKSTATQTAMVAPTDTNLAFIAGPTTVERFIPAKRAFRLLSFPFGSVSENAQESLQEGATSATDNPRPGYGTHITGSTTGDNGFDATSTGNPSMFSLNNPLQTWQAASSTTSTFLQYDRPVRLLVRGSRAFDLENGSAPDDTTLSVTGFLAQGREQQVYTTDATENGQEWFFAGNPYAASVDMGLVLANPNNENVNTGFYYIWDPVINGDNGRGAYVTIDLSDGSNTSGSAANQFLQPGQAFFVAVSTDAAGTFTNLEFEEAHKNIGQETDTFLIDPNADILHLVGKLYRNAGEEVLSDSFKVSFASQYANSEETQDAPKLFNIDESISVQEENKFLAIDRRGLPEEGTLVKLHTFNYKEEAYKLSLELPEFEGVVAYLEDAFLGTSTELVSGENTYYFDVDQSDESADENRFSIAFAEANLATEDNTVLNMSLWPNPVQGDELLIQLPSAESNAVTIKITSILGQEIVRKKDELTNGAYTLKGLQALQAGLYIISVDVDGVVKSQKLIKK